MSSTEGIIRRIEFVGLRRVSPATLRAHVASREGQPLDPARIESDIRALDRLGWFDSVSAEVHRMPVLLANAQTVSTGMDEAVADQQGNLLPQAPLLRLVFVLEERPFLAQLEFKGSRVLRREGIDSILAGRGLPLKLAAPSNPTELWRAARALEAALADWGYPRAQVRVRLKAIPTEAVRATFEIHDGPRVPVARVAFAGNLVFPDEALRRQMTRVAPGALLAGLRGKNIYTPERLAEDLARLEEFYRNRGFPEARLGQPKVEIVEQRARRWFPWPRRQTRSAFSISIPVEAGLFYRLEAVELAGAAARAKSLAAIRDLQPLEPYSQEKLLRARDALAAGLPRPQASGSAPPDVEVIQHFNRSAGTVRVTFRPRQAELYIVRRIEFLGHRRFSDRYYRRRILLKEGEPFDAAKLERGIAQLARSGFIRPVAERDIRLRFDEQRHTADVTVRVAEIGRQRVSLVGGSSGLGNTVGIVYNLFNLFGGEELLTAQFEGGPESLHLLLGLAKEGLFGTRASFGISLFQNVLRPNLPGSRRGRLFSSRRSGLGLAWNYPITPQDTLGLDYEVSQISTRINLPRAEGTFVRAGDGGGSAATGLRGSRRALGFMWTRADDAAEGRGHARLDTTASVAGGWLGGDENLLRSSLEYTRTRADPLSNGRNAWAFRGYLAGVSSYGRSDLPIHARLFSGDRLVRGLRAGELAPFALVKTNKPDGTSMFGAQSAGANMVAAVNTEYTVPLERALAGTKAAAFFDAGTGWLLPNWIGGSRPSLLGGTNGLLRASTGVELRWRVPRVNQTVRLHYAVNPLHLARSMLLPDGSRFRPPDRRSAFGWALGSLFR